MIDNFNFRKYCGEGVGWGWYKNMSYEQPKQSSEGYQLFEEWEGVGEIAEIIGETMLMSIEIPFEILGDIAAEALDGFSYPTGRDSNQ